MRKALNKNPSVDATDSEDDEIENDSNCNIVDNKLKIDNVNKLLSQVGAPAIKKSITNEALKIN